MEADAGRRSFNANFGCIRLGTSNGAGGHLALVLTAVWTYACGVHNSNDKALTSRLGDIVLLPGRVPR